ncbi:NmrA family transcriptional regulator [Gordonia sp. zg691]|uniref:NmrA family transcriptional regulator n=1 Tax=Gordonia jinghuaiqii TaxID=2758710 RepID=A0A7D7LW35_9ACTN|nr:NAD(P)H-binding protein [Gordonia jinghuaiqii]MBD0862044.1 NmrA family transcriptional regulator [Gordonia jinghuaiqii]MCR5978730.1 NmrA family transcriptional regulator [Gordonia jinghuaiqii]QMT03041.1 NmrA family transcriptional regulator [Gordonia jinghuaiqii]
MKVAVIGASGVLGSQVADLLAGRGHDVVRANRATGVDAYTGEGLAQVCAGADAVVDCLSLQTLKAKEAIDFFATAAGNIGRAAAQARVAHVICVSIVNADVPAVNAKFGYYQGKAAQEEAYRKAIDPAALTIVASVQWFELAEQMMGTMSFGPLAVVPKMRCRPAAASDVAVSLADVVVAGPQGTSKVEVAGPAVMDLVDVAKAVAAQQGSPRWVVGVPFGGPAIRGGGLVPDNPDVVTETTLDQWLDARRHTPVGGSR